LTLLIAATKFSSESFIIFDADYINSVSIEIELRIDGRKNSSK